MLPKVSCIMPTCFGEKYVRTALACWTAQNYEGELELVVLDNNVEDVVFGFYAFLDVKYIRTTRKPVGALRNEAIKEATGEIICMWDEDDWSATNRIAAQVDRLLQTGKAVTGWHNVFYWGESTDKTFKYLYSPTGHKVAPYAIGMSHCFRKSWWDKHPYVEQGVEDRIFSDTAMFLGQLDSCDAGQLYVARAHGNNACLKQLGSRHFPEVERSAFPKEFFDAMSVEKNTPLGVKEVAQ
jgi:glycosyltransferase involved in cell wall biosynthesis